MKKLLITLLLISPFSFADWDDVYYCQMTISEGISRQGTRTNYKLEKFSFKLDKTKNAMVFGKKGYFEDSEIPLTGYHYVSSEIWRGTGSHSKTYFGDGTFLYVSTGPMGNFSMIADCEKF
jgi:hypothetical protein